MSVWYFFAGNFNANLLKLWHRHVRIYSFLIYWDLIGTRPTEYWKTSKTDTWLVHSTNQKHSKLKLQTRWSCSVKDESDKDARRVVAPDMLQHICKHYSNIVKLWHFAKFDRTHKKIMKIMKRLIEDDVLLKPWQKQVMAITWQCLTWTNWKKQSAWIVGNGSKHPVWRLWSQDGARFQSGKKWSRCHSRAFKRKDVSGL